MSKYFMRNKQLLVLLLIHFFELSAILINCAVQNISIFSGILFFSYTIFGILVPGLALSKIFRIDDVDFMQITAYSYGLGIAAVIAEYIVTMPLGISWAAPALFFVVLILSFYYLCIINSVSFPANAEMHNKWDSVICAVFAFVILVMEFYTVTLVYTRPSEIVAGNTYHSDFLFWVGNNISAAKGFPVSDYRCVGTEFNYHYFSSLLVAQVSLVTGVNIVDISFFLINTFSCIVVVLCAYTFFRTILGNVILVYASVFFYLFSYGTQVSTQWHMYFCPFGFDYGMSIGLLCMSRVYSLYKKNKVTVKDILLSDILLALCVGMKGTVGLLVLGGFGLLCVNWLSSLKKAVICGINWLLAFGFIYMTFIDGRYTEYTDPGKNVMRFQYCGLRNAYASNAWVMPVFETISDGPLKNLRCLIWYYYNTGRVAFVLLIVGTIFCLISVLKRKKTLPFMALTLMAISVAGLYLGVALVHPGGGSQTYFLMLTVPYSIGCGMYAADLFLSKSVACSKHRLVLAMSWMAILTMVFVTQSYNYAMVLKARIAGGINTNSGAQPLWDSTGKYVNYDQYNAYLWLRDNSDADDIIAIDNMGTVEEYNSQIEIAGVFSERFVWNDFSGLAIDECQRRQSIISGIRVLDDEAVNLLHAADIKYFVQNLYYSNENMIASDSVQMVFSNPAYNVYAIN